MSQPAPRKSIFEIPELAYNLNAYLKPRYSVHLACSNQSMFGLIMPLLWKRVNSTAQFFSLIPGLENRRQEWPVQPVAHPKNIDPAKFSRFDKYAPWVEHLEMDSSIFDHSTDEQLDALCRHSATRALLPNLQSITFMTPYNLVDIAWILPFLSPPLVSLETGTISCGSNPDISTRAFSVLLNALSKHCPSLRTLVVPVSKEITSDPDVSLVLQHTIDGHRSVVEDWLKLSPGLSLASIRPLTSFTTSSDILDAFSLDCISNWPLLERLEIVVQNHDDSLLSGLSESAFPSLKHLGLHGVHDKLALNMFRGTTALLGKLNSIKLMPPGGPYVLEDGPPPVLQLLSVFAEHGPHIQNLWLRVCDPDHPYFGTPISVLGVLRQLPIQALYLEGIYLTGCNNVPGWLVAAFPDLRELGLPSHCVLFAELQGFRDKMPKLQSLSLGFEGESLLPDLDVSLNDIERYRQSPFRTLEVAFHWKVRYYDVRKLKSYTYLEIIRLVQHLFALWPNVQVIEKPNSDSSAPDPETPGLMMELINSHLAELSCCNRDSTIEYEVANILNEGSWRKCIVLTRVSAVLAEQVYGGLRKELGL